MAVVKRSNVRHNLGSLLLQAIVAFTVIGTKALVGSSSYDRASQQERLIGLTIVTHSVGEPNLQVTTTATAPRQLEIMTTDLPFPYKCDLEISFPTARHAETVMKALEVDQDVGDRVTKSFSLKPGINTESLVVLLV